MVSENSRHLDKAHEQTQKRQHESTLNGNTLSPRGIRGGAERNVRDRWDCVWSLRDSRHGASLSRGEWNRRSRIPTIPSGLSRERLRNVVHNNVGSIDGLNWSTSNESRYRNHGCDGLIDNWDFWQSTALVDDGGRIPSNENGAHGCDDPESRWEIIRSVAGEFDTIRVTETSSVFVWILFILGGTAYKPVTSLVGTAKE